MSSRRNAQVCFTSMFVAIVMASEVLAAKPAPPDPRREPFVQVLNEMAMQPASVAAPGAAAEADALLVQLDVRFSGSTRYLLGEQMKQLDDHAAATAALIRRLADRVKWWQNVGLPERDEVLADAERRRDHVALSAALMHLGGDGASHAAGALGRLKANESVPPLTVALEFALSERAGGSEVQIMQQELRRAVLEALTAITGLPLAKQLGISLDRYDPARPVGPVTRVRSLRSQAQAHDEAVQQLHEWMIKHQVEPPPLRLWMPQLRGLPDMLGPDALQLAALRQALNEPLDEPERRKFQERFIQAIARMYEPQLLFHRTGEHPRNPRKGSEAMARLMIDWNPIGFHVSDLKRIVGKPTREDEQVIEYSFGDDPSLPKWRFARESGDSGLIRSVEMIAGR